MVRSARIFAVLAIGGIFACLTSSVSASRSLVLLGGGGTLSGEDELLLTASASGFADGEEIRIKGAFFRSGSANYFGFTKCGDGTWVKNSAAVADQCAVTVGSWDGTVVVRSDSSDSGFSGEGEYLLKLGYYYHTAGGSLSSVSWSENLLTVTINEPDPTSTPTKKPDADPSPTARTPDAPTPLPSATPIPSRKPYPKHTAAFGILGMTDEGATGSADTGYKEPSGTVSGFAGVAGHHAIAVGLPIIGTGMALVAFALSVSSVVWKHEKKPGTD